MVRIYGWVEKSVEARSASGKSVVELDRCVFLFSFFFNFYNDIESIVSFFFLESEKWTGRGEFMGTGFSMVRNIFFIRWKIDKIADRIYFGGRGLEEFLLEKVNIFLFDY